MKVLLVGGGGREHALAWRLSQSPKLTELHAAPGNPGIAAFATCHPVAATDLDGQVALARTLAIDFVVIGPDDPLALGLTDRLNEAGIRAFGPSRAAAQLEWSKAFAKEIMAEAGVPTARYASFTDHEAALAYVRAQGAPLVLKADGLALGKGVIMAPTLAEAEVGLRELMLGSAFGEAGRTVVIEEWLEGPEVSVLALCDGRRALLLPAAQDHKRAGEGDTGPNTGGMGTYCPVPFFGPETARAVEETVFAPVLAAMARRGTPFVGCLFAGLLLTAAGPKVLEFNARFGDPETQAVFPLLEGDLLAALLACAEGHLRGDELTVRPGSAACVVLASGGYPGSYERGLPIAGLDEQGQLPGNLVFHAGTARKTGQFVTAGGRVLGVVGQGRDLPAALAQAYEGAEHVQFPGKLLRRDIGWQAIRREKPR